MGLSIEISRIPVSFLFNQKNQLYMYGYTISETNYPIKYNATERQIYFSSETSIYSASQENSHLL
jgi:hypothetical protein